MRILVTGAGGFIGGHIVRALRKKHKIIAHSRNPHHFDGVILSVDGDLSQGLDIDGRVEAIIHCAARSPHPDIKVKDFFVNNVDGTRRLIEYARDFRVPSLIYLSSVSIYGEISVRDLSEDTPIHNPDAYGVSKYMAEMLLQDERNWLSTTSLRLPGVIGPGAPTLWLAKIAACLLGDQTIEIYNPASPFNNMVDVYDLIQFIDQLLANNPNGFNAINLGCDEPLTIKEIIEILHGGLRSRSEIKIAMDAKAHYIIQYCRARDLGYSSKSVRQILADYIALLTASTS